MDVNEIASFNLVIEILMVDRDTDNAISEVGLSFQSRNRDSYG